VTYTLPPFILTQWATSFVLYICNTHYWSYYHLASNLSKPLRYILQVSSEE